MEDMVLKWRWIKFVKWFIVQIVCIESNKSVTTVKLHIISKALHKLADINATEKRSELDKKSINI